MWYKGKEVGLKEFAEDRKKEYVGKPEWQWENEGLIYAIMDYASSVPYEDWSKDDKRYCLENGWGSRDIKELLKQD